MAVKIKKTTEKETLTESGTQTEQVQDISQFSYRNDSEVVISGELFLKLNNLLLQMVKDEVKIYYEKKDSFEEYIEQEPKILQTEKGFVCNELLVLLGEAHEKNVYNGNAVPVAELTKPNIVPVDAG